MNEKFLPISTEEEDNSKHGELSEDFNVTNISEHLNSVHLLKQGNETIADVKVEKLVENFLARFFGKSAQRSPLYVAISFFVLAFLSWQLMNYSGTKISTPQNKMSPFWLWVNSNGLFFTISSIGVFWAAAFVYLTRRF